MKVHFRHNVPKSSANPANGQVKKVTPETSCALIIDKFDAFKVQAPERANNNLHVWELAEIFKAIGESGGTQYKVLTVDTIAKLYTAETSPGIFYELPYGATAEIENANVIATLNGPMAHIYLKGPGGWSDDKPDMVQLARLAKFLKGYLAGYGALIENEKIKSNFKNLLSSVDRILIRVDGIYKDFKGVEIDSNGNVVGPQAESISSTYFDSNKYVDAYNRVVGMNHAKRSGDIILIMKDDVDVSPIQIAHSRYTAGVACKAWHGSLNRSDSYVPLIVSYPGGDAEELKTVINTPDVCPGLQCDGNWKLTDIIKAVILQQYPSN